MRTIQIWGWVGLSVGVVWLLIAFNMDTSVATNSGFGFPDRVENLGLMAQRQNHIIVSCFVCLVSLLAIIFGGQRSNSPLSIPEQKELIVAPPPDRDLKSDAYRLWLVKHYNIERNDVLNRFVIDNKTFETLDETLTYAESLEQEKIEQERIERERVAEAEKLLRAERKASAAKLDRTILIGAGLFVAVILVGVPYLYFADKKRSEEKVRESNALLQQLGFVRSDDMTNVKAKKVTADEKDTWCDRQSGTLVTFESTNSPESIIHEAAKGAETSNPYSDDTSFIARRFQDAQGASFTLTIFPGKSANVYLCRIEH